MARVFLLPVAVVFVLGGCGVHESKETPTGNGSQASQRATTDERADAANATPGANPTDAAVPPSSISANPSPATPQRSVDAAELPLQPCLPKPIGTDEEAQNALATAARMDANIEKLTGLTSTTTTTRLKDCVAQYDTNKRGYTKYYAGGVRVRLYLRSTAGVADANLFIPERQTAVLHVRMDDTSMGIDCVDLSGDRKVNLTLLRTSTADKFRRVDDWTRITEPDRLEAYCMELYDDFQQLRNE